MSLFETISYSSDKNVVVIDIGAAYTKCGLAGESGPRCIIPSEIKDNKTGKVQKLWDLEKEDKLYEKLKDFLFILYFRHLLLSPKNRRVVVCESMQCQTLFRDTLARVLFKHFEVSSVMFAAGHLMSLLPLGTNTGLVMDVGYTETLVLPVYEGIPVIKAMTCLPLGSKAIHRKIRNLLLETSKANKDAEEDVLLSDLPDCLTESTLEDIKVRCCFVTNMDRAQAIEEVVVRGGDESKMSKVPPSVQYPLDGGMILNISGVVREQSCEVLFEQDNEEESLPTLLLDAVLKCPLDMRRELLHSIVLIGGTAMMPGFHHRLRAELYRIIDKPKYKNELCVKSFKFHKSPVKENYAAWLGGAMVGALETLSSRSVSRESYNLAGHLTDWCSLTNELEIEKEERFPVKR